MSRTEKDNEEILDRALKVRQGRLRASTLPQEERAQVRDLLSKLRYEDFRKLARDGGGDRFISSGKLRTVRSS